MFPIVGTAQLLAVTIIFWKIFTACFVKGIYKFDTDLVKINLIYC